MLDLRLRPLKERLFEPCCQYVPDFVSPTAITLLAFFTGLVSCRCAISARSLPALSFWIGNRVLDCLDGGLARHRNVASDFGGFIDLLGDFIIYSCLPAAIALGWDDSLPCWKAVAVLEGTFHVNNFVLFYIAAISEKKGNRKKELTALAMRPALVEGAESGQLFTAMLIWPAYLQFWCWAMAALVSFSILQRAVCVLQALS